MTARRQGELFPVPEVEEDCCISALHRANKAYLQRLNGSENHQDTQAGTRYVATDDDLPATFFESEFPLVETEGCMETGRCAFTRAGGTGRARPGASGAAPEIGATQAIDAAGLAGCRGSRCIRTRHCGTRGR